MIELDPGRFAPLIPALRAVPVNHLFARSVLERCVDGRAWADRLSSPSLCHVAHPYGMTLLFGDARAVDAAMLREHFDACRRVAHDQWMQPVGTGLAEAVDAVLDPQAAAPDAAPGGARVQRYTRTNFRFDALPRAPLEAPRGTVLRRIVAAEFALDGISVSPHRFWRDARQFEAHGGGWCVERDGRLAAMAFASFRFDDQLEIGVETRPEFRRRGYAWAAAARLIDECLGMGLEPVWSCRKENRGSYELACSLGFEPAIDIPYYRLPAAA
ncbi:MAG: GNAT family N-acetyltransferase [Betaproteobacteria bacterium]